MQGLESVEASPEAFFLEAEDRVTARRIDLRLDPPQDTSRCSVDLEAASVWTTSDGKVCSVLLEMVTLNEAEGSTEAREGGDSEPAD